MSVERNFSQGHLQFARGLVEPEGMWLGRQESKRSKKTGPERQIPGFISKKKSLHSSIQTSATRAEFFMTTLTTPPGNE